VFAAAKPEVWVNDDWVGTTVGTEVESGKIFGDNAFATIQEGVSAVDVGGTVSVAAGEYNENLTITKAVNLVGANKNTTFIKGISGKTRVLSVNDVSSAMSVSGFTIDATNCDSPKRGMQAVLSSNITFEDNNITNIGDMGIWTRSGNIIKNNNITCSSGTTFGGIYVDGIGNTIDGNTITDFTNSNYAIYSYGGTAPVNQNNTITKNIFTANQDGSSGSGYGIYLYNSGGNVIGGTLPQDGNSFILRPNSTESPSYGYGVYIISNPDGYTTSNIIRNNKFDGGNRALQIEGFVGGTTTFSNNIIGATTPPSSYGVMCSGGSAIISGNTFHNVSTPIYCTKSSGVAAMNISVTNNIFDGGASTYAAILASNFNSLTVNENKFNLDTGRIAINNQGSSINATNNWWNSTTSSEITAKISGSVNYNPWYNTDAKTTKTYQVGVGETYTTIQSAINAASASDTVSVAAGTYTERIWIDKALNLLGEDRNTTKIIGLTARDSVIGVATTGLSASTPINIRGFTIDANNNPIDESSWQSGIFIYETDYVTVEQNNFVNFKADGVLIGFNSNHNTVKNNLITCSTDGCNSGVNIYENSGNNLVGGTGVSDQNTISIASSGVNNLYGIYLSGANSKNNTIQNNVINGGTRGIQQDDAFTGLTTISNNNIGSTTAPTFCGLRFDGGNATISNNTLTNTVRPIEFIGVGISITDNIINGGTSYGINLNNYSGTAVIDGNTIHNIQNSNGILAQTGGTRLDITNNIIYDIGGTGAVGRGIQIYAAAVNANINGNEVYNTQGYAAVVLDTGANGAIVNNNYIHDNDGGGLAVNALTSDFFNNRVHDNAWGIELGETDANFVLTGNSISGNDPNDVSENTGLGSVYGSLSIYAGTVEATNNWWGSAALKDISSDISENVTFIPYYINAERTLLSNTLADGSATLDNTSPQVLITNSTSPVTITIATGTTNSTLDVSSLITNGSGTLPQITINTDSINVSIPDSTTVTSDDENWNGIINAPTTTTINLPQTSGETKTLSMAIEVGLGDTKLSFDKAVRMEFPNQAGKRVGFSRNNVFTEITTTCSSDSGDSLGVDQECKVNVGNDLIVWTRHFTKFATFDATSTTTTSSTSTGGGWVAPVCSAAKPGSAPTITSAVGGDNSVTLTWSKAANPVTNYLVAYGTKPGSIEYGNPNVGNSDTTSYTIKGLSGGTRYYFKIKAINDCTPGDWSNEMSSTPGGRVIEATSVSGTTPAEGFTPVSELPSQLFDIALIVDQTKLTKAADLFARVTFISFGREDTPVEMTFTVIDEDGKEYYRSIDKTTIQTEGVFNKTFPDLILAKGKYTLVLNTLYNTNVRDEFKQVFEIGETTPTAPNKLLMISLGSMVIVVIIIMIFMILKKKSRRIINRYSQK